MNGNQKWGRYVTIDPENPQALGICDYSGFVFPRKDMVRQMEWRGNDLVWTGFYVGRPFADIPNPQAKIPIFKPDPVPVLEPRPPSNSIVYWGTDQAVFGQNQYTFGSTPGYQQEINAMPEAQRLQSLQNFYWGA